MHDLGMELHPVDPTIGVVESGHLGVRALSGRNETLGHHRDGVAVTHPHFSITGPVDEDRRPLREGQGGATVLAASGTSHFTAQLQGKELGAVADTEYRYAGVIDSWVDLW